MKWFFSPHQRAHTGGIEMNRGALVPCHESTDRCDIVAQAMEQAGFGVALAPADHGETLIRTLHEGPYVDFLRTAYDEWLATGREGSALPFTFVGPGMSRDRIGPSVFARLGAYCFDVGTPIVAGTWDALYWSAQTALSGADALLAGDALAFALCRPPGHHAGVNQYGGYCFLNNAGLAAQALREGGHQKVAILDVDYHHGNGTQEIFWTREDVFYGSLHADPQTDFPYFSGFAEERGEDAGRGTTLNCPLPRGTDWAAYRPALVQALEAMTAFGPSALVLSLGVDTWYGDPISGFALQTPDFYQMGATIGQTMAEAGCPTLVVMEGGYAVSEVGHNVVQALRGLQSAYHSPKGKALRESETGLG